MSYHQFPKLYDERLAPVRAETGGSNPISSSGEVCEPRSLSEQENRFNGPDFGRGIPLEDLAEGSMILGHVAGEGVLLARTGGALFAIGAECTHYHGPLAEGVLIADTVRCPWHHACFSMRTGEALRARR